MTDRAGLRQRLHELHALGVDLDQGQQVTGAHRLVQVHHLGRRRRARLAGVLVVHILGVDELLPHRPDGKGVDKNVDKNIDGTATVFAFLLARALTCRWRGRAWARGTAGCPP